MEIAVTLHPYAMGAAPCIRGLRVPVAAVAHLVAKGVSVEEIYLALSLLASDGGASDGGG